MRKLKIRRDFLITNGPQNLNQGSGGGGGILNLWETEAKEKGRLPAQRFCPRSFYSAPTMHQAPPRRLTPGLEGARLESDLGCGPDPVTNCPVSLGKACGILCPQAPHL